MSDVSDDGSAEARRLARTTSGLIASISVKSTMLRELNEETLKESTVSTDPPGLRLSDSETVKSIQRAALSPVENGGADSTDGELARTIWESADPNWGAS